MKSDSQDLDELIATEHSFHLVGSEISELLSLLVEVRNRTASRKSFNLATYYINRLCSTANLPRTPLTPENSDA